MTPNRRAWVLGAVALLAACAAPSLVEDRDYAQLTSPQPVQGGDRIEVVEFFWYGCPHCADMHPKLQAWAARQPGDVLLRYEPAVLAAKWEAGARLHFTLAALGAGRLAGEVFDAVQINDLNLDDEAGVLRWAAGQGLDAERFGAVWRSPEVARQLAQSRGLAARYQIKGVPALIVDGRFLTSNAFTGSVTDTLQTVDALVHKVRAERAGKR